MSTVRLLNTVGRSVAEPLGLRPGTSPYCFATRDGAGPNKAYQSLLPSSSILTRRKRLVGAVCTAVSPDTLFQVSTVAAIAAYTLLSGVCGRQQARCFPTARMQRSSTSMLSLSWHIPGCLGCQQQSHICSWCDSICDLPSGQLRAWRASGCLCQTVMDEPSTAGETMA